MLLGNCKTHFPSQKTLHYHSGTFHRLLSHAFIVIESLNFKRFFFTAFRYDKEVFDISVNGEEHTIKLIDTAGQEEYERVRKLFYKEANCFILCYDISNRTSFTNILQKWLPELQSIEKWPTPFVLVGK